MPTRQTVCSSRVGSQAASRIQPGSAASLEMTEGASAAETDVTGCAERMIASRLAGETSRLMARRASRRLVAMTV